MSKAHASLTGSSLHEPKGVAAATSNTVYVADGAGSGVWEKLPSAALGSNANPFGSALLHVREEQTSGTNSGSSFTVNTWSTCTLNTTKTNEISATLAGNHVALAAGTYYAEGRTTLGVSAGGSINISQRLKLRDTTNSVDLVLGDSMRSTFFASEVKNWPNFVSGRFTLSGSANVELQLWENWGAAPGGYATTSGSTEVYSDLRIWKIS